MTKQVDMFTLPVDALVNTVNVREAVMGAGVAAQFAHRWPQLIHPYREACRSGALDIGKVMVAELPADALQRFVIHFPTKASWRDPSRIEYISAALPAFIQALREHEIRSVAIPALGCGLGGLDWPEVRAMVEKALREVPDVKATLIPPATRSYRR